MVDIASAWLASSETKLLGCELSGAIQKADGQQSPVTTQVAGRLIVQSGRRTCEGGLGKTRQQTPRSYTKRTFGAFLFCGDLLKWWVSFGFPTPKKDTHNNKK